MFNVCYLSLLGKGIQVAVIRIVYFCIFIPGFCMKLHTNLFLITYYVRILSIQPAEKIALSLFTCAVMSTNDDCVEAQLIVGVRELLHLKFLHTWWSHSEEWYIKPWLQSRERKNVQLILTANGEIQRCFPRCSS